MIQQLVYDEVKLSMSKISIVILMLSLMFLGALFFVIGYLSALTSINSGTATSQASWQTLSTTHPEEHHSSQKEDHGLGSFFHRYAGSQAQQGLSSLKSKESEIALMIPKPLQPFARYGVGQANIQTRKLSNQVNPFANAKNSGMRPTPQYDPPPPQQYEPVQSQYNQPSQYPYPQQGYPPPQLQYQQPSQYPYSQQGYYPPPQPQYQPPPPYATRQGRPY